MKLRVPDLLGIPLCRTQHIDFPDGTDAARGLAIIVDHLARHPYQPGGYLTRTDAETIYRLFPDGNADGRHDRCVSGCLAATLILRRRGDARLAARSAAFFAALFALRVFCPDIGTDPVSIIGWTGVI